LKERKSPPKPGAPLALPKKASRQETVAEITASTAFSCVLWPVELPDDPKHNAALALASAVLRDHLLLIVRETMGATYSPQTRVHRDIIQRDFAYVGMINTFDPASARKYTEGSVRLAARLAEKGLTVPDFERLREPLRARYAEDMRSNGWWLNEIVALAQSHPDVLAEARQHEKILDGVTIEDVNQAAQVFKTDKVTIVIVQPKSAGELPGNVTKKK
jgi:predicted Zn-dependent peptidase